MKETLEEFLARGGKVKKASRGESGTPCPECGGERIISSYGLRCYKCTPYGAKSAKAKENT